MNNVWPNSEGLVDSLWFHEWNKHGTCMTTLEPGCTSSDKLELDSYQGIIDYFSSAVDLYSRFPVFQALARRNILPGRIYQTTLVASAIEEELGILPNLQCDTNGTLSELWLYFYVKGPIKYLEFYPTQPDSTSSCNVSLYYPKKYPSNPYPVTNVIP
ncbi:ribonuclease T2 family protein [Phycomyces blakesleeanus]